MVKSGEDIGEIRDKEKNSVELFDQINPMHADLLWKIEQGKILPSKWELVQIAGRFGLSTKTLLIAQQRQLIAKSTAGGRPVSERTQLLVRDLKQWEEKLSSVQLIPLSWQLAGCVESIVYFESLDQPYAFEKVMPDGMAKLVINLDESLPVVIGQHDMPLCIDLKKNIRKIIVRFQPYGLYLLTGIPQNHLLNRVLDAVHIFGKAMNELQEKLCCCKPPIQMELLLNNFFIERVPDAEDHVVERHVMDFVINHIDDPIATLVEKAGYSYRHLIHLFRNYTGLTPKVFQQVKKFAVSINEISLLPTQQLSNASWKHDYFDDAHFIRQFNRFSGFTPSDYLKTGNTCARLVFSNEAEQHLMNMV